MRVTVRITTKIVQISILFSQVCSLRVFFFLFLFSTTINIGRTTTLPHTAQKIKIEIFSTLPSGQRWSAGFVSVSGSITQSRPPPNDSRRLSVSVCRSWPVSCDLYHFIVKFSSESKSYSHRIGCYFMRISIKWQPKGLENIPSIGWI